MFTQSCLLYNRCLTFSHEEYDSLVKYYKEVQNEHYEKSCTVDACFLLSDSAENCQERIKKINRKSEENITLEYLENLDSLHLRFAERN